MEFSEGKYRPCKGGWHWLAEVRASEAWAKLGSHGCFMATVIGSIVKQNESECELSVADMRRLTGTRDSKTSRCTIGTKGVQELTDAGLVERLGNSDSYRVVMPDCAGTSHVPGTQHVPQRTCHVPAGTSHVPNGTCHVPRIKEEERERIPEKTQSACAREAAARCFAEYPDQRRTNPSNFSRLFEVAVQAWGVRYDVDRPTAIEQVEAKTLAHIAAHRRDGTADRFFPAPRRFFEEFIDNEPAQPEVSPENQWRKALEGLTW